MPLSGRSPVEALECLDRVSAQRRERFIVEHRAVGRVVQPHLDQNRLRVVVALVAHRHGVEGKRLTLHYFGGRLALLIGDGDVAIAHHQVGQVG